jgi:hypothetical protein
VRGRRAGAPDVDGGEQEQPDHVDEVPVPGSGLETEVLLRGVGPLIARIRQTSRKIVPTMTWKPWKPVAMKKVAP